tara:strand:- start:962 stop:1249 length:288 start_codon:yes stop_codon:yes gene_type:complete
MFRKLKIYNFTYFLIIILGIFYLFIGEKNLFVLFKNENRINDNKILLSEKKEIKNELEKKIDSFTNSEVYKELILKEKLFLKNENDKLIFYKLDN